MSEPDADLDPSVLLEPPDEDEEDVPKRKKFRCKGCNYTHEVKWRGPCPNPLCMSLCDIVAPKVEDETSVAQSSLAAAEHAKPRVFISTGVPEVDRVLGGGFVKDCVVMIGGERGIGKTTVNLQIANGFSVGKRRTLFASGEENQDAIFQVAKRLKIFNERVVVVGNEGDIYKLVARVREEKFNLLVVDSLQTAFLDDVDADVGQATQIDAVTNWLTSFAKEEKVAVLIVCHMNAQNELAGSKKSQHLVDALLRFDRYYDEDDPENTQLRELSMDGKNRLGPDDVRAVLEMTSEGLKTPEGRRSKWIK